jgi:hypothetical protein
MKSEQPEIDKLFNEKLYNVESKPKSDSWAAIAGKLDKQEEEKITFKSVNKSYRFKFYYAAAAVFLILVLSSVLLKFFTGDRSSVIADQQAEVFKPSEKPSSITPKNLNHSLEKTVKTKQSVKDSKKVQPEDVLITLKTIQEKKDFYLPDSSRIFVNRNSEISYHENFENNRTLHITGGEVFFEVKHKNNQPFVVYANRSRTEVVGTSFMIKSYKEDSLDEIFVSS